MHTYLAQWATHKYGNPIRFPAGSVQNAALRASLTRLPSGIKPNLPGKGKVPVVLPDSKAKPVCSFNHLPHDAQRDIANLLQDLLKLQLWKDMRPLLDDDMCLPAHTMVMKAVRSWCKTNGIDIEYDNTIKQKWYRLRELHGFRLTLQRRRKNLV